VHVWAGSECKDATNPHIKQPGSLHEAPCEELKISSEFKKHVHCHTSHGGSLRALQYINLVLCTSQNIVVVVHYIFEELFFWWKFCKQLEE